MKEDGGPAFACAHSPEENAGDGSQGMSLRDYFAIHASEKDVEDMLAIKPAGMLSRQQARFICADAMIAEREKE